MRVLFHAVDGTGLGHLVRTSLLARALAERVAGLEALVVTNAADTSMLERASPRVNVLRLPYTNLDEAKAGDDPTPLQVNARAFLAAARAFEPDLAVFDTHVPKVVIQAPTLQGRALALVLRTLTADAAQEMVRSGVAAAFDRIVVPADLGAPSLPEELRAPPLGPRVVSVGPILRARPLIDERRAARRHFGVADGARLVVATLGGGGAQLAPLKRSTLADSESYAQALADALGRFARAHPEARCVLQVGAYASSLPAPAPGDGSVNVLRADALLPALLEGADLAVSLAGYNTTWEIARAGTPSILLTKRSRHESQAARAHALLALGGAAAVVERADPGELQRVIDAAYMDERRLVSIREALAAIDVPDGVEAAADVLLELARAPIQRLAAPGPCLDPCEGCPVPVPATPVDRGFLADSGERRVLVSCSLGVAPDFAARLAAVRDAGLVPVVETTGRMAKAHAPVRAALLAGAASRLLLFGMGKKLHQRASRAPGSFAATLDLADLAPDAPAPEWRLHTRRFERTRDDRLEPIDRRVLFRSEPRAGSPPVVAFLRKRWLPYSEIFVHAEAAALTRYRPLAVCKDTLGERLPGVPVLTLGDTPPDRAAHTLRAAGVVLFHAVFATCAPSFLRLVRLMGLPLVVSVRGHDLYREPHRDLSPVFAQAARLLARTDEMAADLLLAGAPRERVAVMPTGLPLAAFPFRTPAPPRADEPLRVVMVGRFTAKKGLADGIRAFEVLARADPRARLTVFGRGHIDEDEAIVAELEALVSRPPLVSRVTLRPAVPRHVLADALAQAHLFLCPSRTAPDGDREGLPNALKEAMAIGLPVIATDHGAIGALVRGAAADVAEELPAGLVVPEGDVVALGDALVELARAPERWGSLARAGRRRVERAFDLAKITASMESMYDNVRGLAGRAR